MGDFRADIKIRMNLLGKDYKYDCWINYSPNDCGVDERVAEFFNDCWIDAKMRHDRTLRKLWEKENKEQIEKEEKEELKRLQQKYIKE